MFWIRALVAAGLAACVAGKAIAPDQTESGSGEGEERAEYRPGQSKAGLVREAAPMSDESGFNPGMMAAPGLVPPPHVTDGGSSGYNPGREAPPKPDIVPPGWVTGGGGGYNSGQQQAVRLTPQRPNLVPPEHVTGGTGYNPGYNGGNSGYNPGQSQFVRLTPKKPNLVPPKYVTGGSGYNPGQQQQPNLIPPEYVTGGGGYNPGQPRAVKLYPYVNGYNPGYNSGYNPGQPQFTRLTPKKPNILPPEDVTGGSGYNPGYSGGYNPGAGIQFPGRAGVAGYRTPIVFAEDEVEAGPQIVEVVGEGLVPARTLPAQVRPSTGRAPYRPGQSKQPLLRVLSEEEVQEFLAQQLRMRLNMFDPRIQVTGPVGSAVTLSARSTFRPRQPLLRVAPREEGVVLLPAPLEEGGLPARPPYTPGQSKRPLLRELPVPAGDQQPGEGLPGLNQLQQHAEAVYGTPKNVFYIFK